VENRLVCRLSRLTDGLLAFLATVLDPGLNALSFFRADVNCAGCFGLRHFESRPLVGFVFRNASPNPNLMFFMEG
jgi:hypothetical protein